MTRRARTAVPEARAAGGGTTRFTTCVLDCGDTCAVEVEVRDGRIVRLGAAAGHPDTAGFLCGKVAGFDRRVYHPYRVLHPLRRVGAKGEGRFERVSWPEAIEQIRERFERIRRRWGGEAILPFHYGGSNGLVSDELIDHLFFARLGASRLDKTICAVPATRVATAMYGKMPGVAFGDYPHARLIVVWGANPRGSNIHLVPYLREARRRGAFVAAVDPRNNFARHEVDLHLPVLPGEDLPLALGLIDLLERAGAVDRELLAGTADGVETLLAAAREWPLERAARVSGVEPAAIERLAAVMGERRPAVMRCGWGLERNRNGAQAIAAVLALPALLGWFGERGGGYTLSNNGGVRFDRDRVLGPLEWHTRRLNMTQLGRLLTAELEPPIRALFVYNANPVATVPRQGRVLRGLARDELFTVVHEQVMTDTARFADLVLPAPTFLETRDLRVGYGSYVVGGVAPVIEARGEARSNVRLFSELGRAMGFSDPAFNWSEEETVHKVAAALSIPGAVADLDRLAAGGQQPYGFDGAPPVQLETVQPLTPDGRIRLAPAELGARPFEHLAAPSGGPLTLISPASSRRINSTLGEVGKERLRVDLHPEDAACRGLEDGQAVRVHNALGEVHCALRVDPALRPGVASMAKGAWSHASLNGATSVALCPDDAQRVGDAACFNDARVEVEALAPSPARL